VKHLAKYFKPYIVWLGVLVVLVWGQAYVNLTLPDYTSKIFVKIERFSLSEFNTFSSSSLVTRATNDMQQIQNVLAMMLRMAFLEPFMGVGSIIKAHQLAPSMSWIILVAIGILVAMIIVLFFVAIPKFTIIQKLVDKLSLQTREMLTGVRTDVDSRRSHQLGRYAY
jgi:ABC-type multidrug transport system fused ATPase/permease subunit